MYQTDARYACGRYECGAAGRAYRTISTSATRASSLLATSRRKSDPPAIDPFLRLQPQVEPKAIHGGQRRLVGVLARIVPGDQPEGRGVIGIHILDDSRGGIHQRIGPGVSIV